MTAPLLAVRDLTVRFRTRAGLLTAVDRLDLGVAAGETLAIVGESGCGKSTAALALARLLSPRTAEVTGSVHLDGVDLLALSDRAMRQVRGRRIGLVFQDPITTLNPVMTVGAQLVEAVRAHRGMGVADAKAEARRLLDLVRIPAAAARLGEYPHRLSGGMCQRVGIALALAGQPGLLVADEPTTALDVTIQADILRLLVELKRELAMALVLITHDLGLVAEVADRVLVMYAGRKVEERPVADLFCTARHPYSGGLLRARPSLQTAAAVRRAPLAEIPGAVPGIGQRPEACAFAPRCAQASDLCRHSAPDLLADDGGLVACHHPLPALRLAAE